MTVLHAACSGIQFLIEARDFSLQNMWTSCRVCDSLGKVKVIPQQAEVALGVLGRLRPQIFLTFGTTRVVGCQPYAPADFSPGEIPGTHFQGLSRPQGTWFCRGEPQKKSPVTPLGIDPETVRLVMQCLNHYATPSPHLHWVPGVKWLGHEIDHKPQPSAEFRNG